jgi:hypothetical protein
MPMAILIEKIGKARLIAVKAMLPTPLPINIVLTIFVDANTEVPIMAGREK